MNIFALGIRADESLLKLVVRDTADDTHAAIQDLDDLTTGGMVGSVIIQFVSNPFLIGLTIFKALNMVPDGTTRGIGDSERAMTYLVPK